jgi:hypothetical protein
VWSERALAWATEISKQGAKSAKKYAIICVFTNTARVVKLVDSGDSKSPAARRAGSSPAPGTILKIKHLAVLDFFLAELELGFAQLLEFAVQVFEPSSAFRVDAIPLPETHWSSS